jgi:hypothetical protein
LPNSTHETTVITFKDNIEKMSEIIFVIIACSITLKAKQKDEEEEKKNALLSCTKSK